MRHLCSILMAGIAGLAIGPAAEASRPSSSSLYMRARAAEVAGDTHTANAGFAALLAEDPGNSTVATRAYRQALGAGDIDLALHAAHLLESQDALPSDARILLALEQIKTHQWARARAATDELAEDRVFGFLSPYFRAWIARASGSGDPLALMDGGSGLPMSQPYQAGQRALMLIALGRPQDASAAIGPQTAPKLPASIKDAEHGIAPLLLQVSADFARQQFTPVGMILARMATYIAPDEAAGWLIVAELLDRMHRPDLAIAALDHVAPHDPLASDARALRIAALNDAGRHEEALTEALAAARRDKAGPDDWGRVGDLQLILERPADAAEAYAKAVTLADAAHAPPDTLWPLLLQQGGALDLAGDWEHARAVLDRAYAIAPEQATVLNQVGYSQIEHRENVAKASAMIAQASKLRPDDPAITDSIGWVLFLQGKVADAVPLLERAAAGAPGEAAINEHLGDAYWAQGRRYEARYAWRAALVTAADKDRPRLTTKIDTGLSGTTAAP